MPKTFVRGGETRQGAKMININRKGLLVWPTQAMVTDLRAGAEDRLPDPRELDDLVLHPRPHRRRRHPLVQRREAPKGISDVSVRLTKAVLGGVDGFTAELVEGMNQTLARIKADAERARAAEPGPRHTEARTSAGPIARGRASPSRRSHPAVRVVLELERPGVGELVLARPGELDPGQRGYDDARARSGDPRRAPSRPGGGRRSPRAGAGAARPPRRRTRRPRSARPASPAYHCSQTASMRP